MEQKERSLDSLKAEVESLFLSRDQKMASNMLPYFEEDGVFAAIGFGHLYSSGLSFEVFIHVAFLIRI